MDDRDREPRAVHLRERGREVVLQVVAHREHGRLRVGDPLAFEEVRIESGRVVDAGPGQLLGNDARALPRSFDQPHADPLLEQQPRDGGPGAPGAEDDDVLDRSCARGDQLGPGLRRRRRSDHDDPVVRPGSTRPPAESRPCRRG